MHHLRSVASERGFKGRAWVLSPDTMRALQLETGIRPGRVTVLGLPVRTHDDAEIPVEMECDS